MMRVTYLGHSGFLVESDRAYFLFDYYRGELPEMDRGKKMIVFVSHSHYDHFNRDVFRLQKEFDEIRYVLSADENTKQSVADGQSGVIFMGPNEEQTVSGCTVRTLRSNDEGVAYLVRCDGKTIYHAGDLNWWHWEGEPEAFNKAMRRSYQSEINKLEPEKIDVAFVPVDPRLGEQYCWGIDCFMKRTRTDRVFPMHFWGNYDVFERLMLEKCTADYRERIVKIEREGQQFDL